MKKITKKTAFLNLFAVLSYLISPMFSGETVSAAVKGVQLYSSQTVEVGEQTKSFQGKIVDEEPTPFGNSVDKVYNVQVTYGNGSTWTGTASSHVLFTIPGTTYQQSGVYNVVLSITGSGEIAPEGSVNVTVNDPAPEPDPQPDPDPKPEPQPEPTPDPIEEDTNGNEDNEEEIEEVLGVQNCDVKSEVSGYVYFDENEDSEMNDGEQGAEDVQVKIYEIDENGQLRLVARKSTDGDGMWDMDLCPGDYKVKVNDNTLPDGAELVSEEAVEITIEEGEDMENVSFALEGEASEGSEENEESGFNWLWVLVPVAVIAAAGGVFLFVKKRKESEKNDSKKSKTSKK